MAKVRRIKPGDHLAEWSKLLDQLTAVKTRLLDAQQRAAYDQKLRQTLTRPAPGKAVPGSGQSKMATPPPPGAKQPAADQRPRSPFPVGYTKPPVYADAAAGVSPPPNSAQPKQPQPTQKQPAQKQPPQPKPAAAPKPVPAKQPAPAVPSLFDADLMTELGPPVEMGPAPIVAAPQKKTALPLGPILAVVGLVLILVVALVVYSSHRRTALAAKYGPIRTVSPAIGPSTGAPAPPPPALAQSPAPPAPPSSPQPPAAPAQPANMETPKANDAPALKVSEKDVGAPGRSFGQTPKVDAPKKEPERTPPEVSERPHHEPSKPAVDLKMTPEFAKAVEDVRTALGNRDLAAAAKAIKVALQEAESDGNREQVERLQVLLDNSTEFWKGIQASIAKLQAAEEIVIKDTRIVVVDNGRDFLTVKAEGRVHRFQMKTLPTSLIMALVNQNFGQDGGSKAVIGTFLAVDANGDRELARKYWREAAAAGVDTDWLIPEIDVMPPVVKKSSSLQKRGR